VAMAQKCTRVAVLTLLSVFTLATVAFAHDQFDVAEVGPPMAASAVLGVVSYWLVMLWPLDRWLRERKALVRRRRSRARMSLVR